jgi:hypothetical protein
MKLLNCALVIANLLVSAPALACSATELGQKQRAYADAAKAAYERDPGGDAARQESVQAVIARYKDKMTGGAAAIDAICKENDELLTIYK